MIDSNITPCLEKMKIILQTWKQRNLTLLGKVLVINSLVVSTLVYRMSVLPLLSKQYYNAYNKMILDFIWEGKKAKIPLKVLQGNKEEGGLALFSIDNRDLALKIKWIFKLEQDPMLNLLANDALENNMGSTIWNCTIRPQDIQLVTNRQNFWMFGKPGHP